MRRNLSLVVGTFLLVAVVVSCSEKQKEAARLEAQMRDQLLADSSTGGRQTDTGIAPVLGSAAEETRDTTGEGGIEIGSGLKAEGNTAGGALDSQAPTVELSPDSTELGSSATAAARIDASIPDAGAIPAEEQLRTPEAVEEASGGGYVVQIGSTPDRRSADEMASVFSDRGYQAYLAAADVNGVTYYRVRVGKFGSGEEAKAVRDDIAGKYGVNGFVTRVK